MSTLPSVLHIVLAILVALVSTTHGAVYVDVKILSVIGQTASAELANSLETSFKSSKFSSVDSIPVTELQVLQAAEPPANSNLVQGAYDRCVFLSEKFNYKFMWRIDTENQTIQAAQQADINGWAAVGLSTDGKMISGGAAPGSDIILSYVSDSCTGGCSYDYSAVRYEPPALDASNDVVLVGGGKAGNSMVVEWTRKLDTGDTVGDRVFTVDTPTPFIWALNPNEPPSTPSSFSKHAGATIGGIDIAFGFQYSCEGNAVIRLTLDSDKFMTKSRARSILDSLASLLPTSVTNRNRITIINITDAPSNHTAFCPDCMVYDMKMKQYTVPATMTTYVCTGFTIPISKKYHIIRFEPIIDNSAVIHHMVGYKANAAWSEGVTTPCDGMPTAVQPTPIYAWAPGGTMLDLPQEVGFPSGPESADQIYHVIIQFHYNNPTKKAALIDNSGLRIYLSPTIRKYDGGFLFLGVPTRFVSVPPKQNNWHTAGVCPSTVTEKIVYTPDKKLHIFSIGFHAHLIGKSLWTERIRNNQSTLLMADKNYDFNSQGFHNIEYDILPGDTLITHCVWDSSNKSETTKGGEATSNEMCLAPILYYPNMNIGSCTLQHTDGISCGYPCSEQPYWAIMESARPSSQKMGVLNVPIIIGIVVGVVILVVVIVIIVIYRDKPPQHDQHSYSRVPLEDE